MFRFEDEWKKNFHFFHSFWLFSFCKLVSNRSFFQHVTSFCYHLNKHLLLCTVHSYSVNSPTSISSIQQNKDSPVKKRKEKESGAEKGRKPTTTAVTTRTKTTTTIHHTKPNISISSQNLKGKPESSFPFGDCRQLYHFARCLKHTATLTHSHTLIPMLAFCSNKNVFSSSIFVWKKDRTKQSENKK